MSVVYLLSKGCKAKRDNYRLLVEYKEQIIQSIPIKDVECVVLGENTHISTPLIDYLLDMSVSIVFIDFFGNIRGSFGSDTVSWQRTKKQMDCFMKYDSQIQLVQWLVEEKLSNQNKMLKYYAKYKRDLEIGQYAGDIHLLLASIKNIYEVDMLRGIEGIAAKKYFSAFELIVDDSKWNWQGRNRRPAQDPINALLNYGYAFLEREVRIAIVGAGLDARFGFMHSNNGRKDSLVFDLMELFRQPVIDRLVLSCINRNQFSPDQFDYDEKLGCRVGKDVKIPWIRIYEDYMNKVYKEYNNLTPREWIRKKVKEFAILVFNKEVVAA